MEGGGKHLGPPRVSSRAKSPGLIGLTYNIISHLLTGSKRTLTLRDANIMMTLDIAINFWLTDSYLRAIK